MEYIILDTNIFKKLVKDDGRVVKEFFNEIYAKSVSTKTIFKECMQIEKVHSKHYNDCSITNKSNIDINTLKIEITKQFEEILVLLKDINYQINNEIFNNFYKARNHFRKERENFIKDIKIFKYYEENSIMVFIESLRVAIDEIEASIDNKRIENIRDKICEYEKIIQKLLDIVRYNRDDDRLLLNYLSIEEYLNSISKLNGLTINEVNDVKKYCESTKDSYWGFEDSNKSEAKRYNDQFIWREINKFSKENSVDIVLITEDFKEMKNEKLKENMIKEFELETSKTIKIFNIEEYEIYNDIKNKINLNKKIEDIVIKLFIDEKESENIINEIIEFVNSNEEEITDELNKNKEEFEEIYFDLDDDDDDDDDVISGLVSKIEDLNVNYDDLEDIELSCSCNRDKGKLACNIILQTEITDNLNINIVYWLCSIEEDKVRFTIKEVYISSYGKSYDCFVLAKNSVILAKYNNLLFEEQDFKCYLNKGFKDIETNMYYQK